MSDIGEPEDVARRAQSAEDVTAVRRRTICTLAQHVEGRDFLWWLMEQGRVYGSSLRADGSGRGDPMLTAWEDGWRSLGLLLTEEVMMADPRAYVQMLKEKRLDRPNK